MNYALKRKKQMSNLDVIKALYESIANKDWHRFRDLTDPELEWVQNKGFPKGRHSHGVEEVVKNVFDVFAKDWETWSFEIEEHLDAGDKIITLGAYQGRHKETGKKFTAAAAHVFDLKNGCVLRFRQYTDTAQIWKAMTKPNQ